ncbi:MULTISPECIES: esterase/lipase family protein [Acinetobacter]|uniref:esterase/lipase family protein n=1 Tax=Acinetobacter TaxID=469 RepID=UPI0015B63856|nr:MULTISPECIES: alpha/beta hydrolase [Acinetobacter]MBT0887647.1 alpha/beta hydrolase [Acinetobacter towneri]MDV2456214.1 alpha/beta hydrolase [Acinetobacter towneri]NWJ93053.1 alpha/beta hydrolase [Acinetobacter sp. Swhac1]WOE29915.1 alpha/beta hydrolase [Acinetobacter towneri]
MNKIVIAALLSTTLLSGCQVVSVKNQALKVSIANERDSILSRKKISEASLNVLSMTGREATICAQQPAECVSALKQIPQIQDEQLLSTASELYLAKAIALENSSSCKIGILNSKRSEEQQKINQANYEQCLDQQLNMLDQSIRYSYAYMFQTKRAPQDRIFDNRQVQIRDFYNQAIAKLVSSYALRYKHDELQQQIRVGNSIYEIDFDHYPQLKQQKIQQLMSTYNLNFSGLRSITRRDGFGSEFLVVLPENPNDDISQSKYIIDPLKHDYPSGKNPNIHQARYLAATLTAEPLSARSIEDILYSSQFKLKAYDPYKYEAANIAQKNYPLAANFSAPYGLWLAQNNLGKSAYLSLIDREERLSMPHLYLLEPYNPNKKVIVLIHGLASSPEAWVRLTNDIMGDPVLRENFQVWQVFYSTNMPILESRFQIYALLQQGFKQVNSSAAAKKDAVVIGHSMGGILARLLVSDTDLTQPAMQMLKNRRLERFKSDPLLQARLRLKPITNFDRAIFLAAPHRGTEFADRWFTLAARKVIRLPTAFLSAFADTLQQHEVDLKNLTKEIGHGVIQNGPSDLSKNSKFTELTEDILPVKGFKYHSIIGNNTDSTEHLLMNDDVVHYNSAHLDGAVSEKIIKGGHSIQETPEAVLELRRILRLHLQDLGLYKP